jgi:hypothetical protein
MPLISPIDDISVEKDGSEFPAGTCEVAGNGGTGGIYNSAIISSSRRYIDVLTTWNAGLTECGVGG